MGGMDEESAQIRAVDEALVDTLRCSPTMTHRDTLERVYEGPHWTWRSLVVGCALGTVISMSNFYLGFKMGWSFGAGIFGSIFGYTILSNWIRVFGGAAFTPQEHATLCSAAGAAGDGTTAGYISGIPAMYRLGLLGTVMGDLPRLGLWSLSASVYGALFAIPFRKYFIIKQNLPFPSPTAAAQIIKSLHNKEGAAEAKRKSYAMFITLVVILAYCILSFWIPVMKEWHVLYWIGESNPTSNWGHTLLEGNSWNFYISVSFAFIGAGMMTPLNTSVSLVGGALTAWGVLGPLLMKHAIDGVNTRFALGTNLAAAPSARFWLLWPGICLMIAASFTELACNGKMLLKGFQGFFGSITVSIRRRVNRKDNALHKKHEDAGLNVDEDDEFLDPVPPEHQVPTLWWAGGLLVTVLFTVILLYVAFDVAVGEAILGILLGIIFGFIACQSSGETDINPTGSIAKTSQAVLALIPNDSLRSKQTSNLISGLVAAAAASQSSSMVGDLKTGHLVGASPKSQFLAQIFGGIFSSVLGMGFWALFASAYPCIIDIDGDEECIKKGFGLQAVTAWYGVTYALTGEASIPSSSLYTAIALALFTICFVVFKNKFIPRPYHAYLPNFNAIGIAFVNPDSSLVFSILFGSLVSLVWTKYRPSSSEMYLYSIASGFIAAEGIFGIVQAVLTILNIEPLTTWGMVD